MELDQCKTKQKESIDDVHFSYSVGQLLCRYVMWQTPTCPLSTFPNRRLLPNVPIIRWSTPGPSFLLPPFPRPLLLPLLLFLSSSSSLLLHRSPTPLNVRHHLNGSAWSCCLYYHNRSTIQSGLWVPFIGFNPFMPLQTHTISLSSHWKLLLNHSINRTPLFQTSIHLHTNLEVPYFALRSPSTCPSPGTVYQKQTPFSRSLISRAWSLLGVHWYRIQVCTSRDSNTGEKKALTPSEEVGQYVRAGRSEPVSGLKLDTC